MSTKVAAKWYLAAKVNGSFPIRLFLLLLAAVFTPALPGPPWVRADGLPRERDAFYLEDFLTQPYRLKVLASGPMYFNADRARFLGTLRVGQLVELQAVTGNGALCRVRGLATQGQVVGWIDARYLSPLDPAFIDGMRRNLARQERVKTLLAANEVALGMTPAEVTTGLGPPPKRSSRTDTSGVSERWEYIRYQQVPRLVTGVDPFGRIVTSTVYERVAVGSYAVVFTDDLVSAVEQSDGGASGAGQVKSVPPPVSLQY